MSNTELLTIEALCEKLHVCRNTAYHLLATKRIVGFKVGRSWRISADAVETFIANHLNNEKEDDHNEQNRNGRE